MTATEVLLELERRGAVLSVKDNGRLLVDAPKGAVTDDLLAELKTHKPDLLRLLTPVGRLRCGDCREAVDLLPHPDRVDWLRFACGHRRIERDEYERWLRVTQHPSAPSACGAAFDAPPCPRCGSAFDAAPAESGGGCLRLLCAGCKFFALACPQGAAEAACLRCSAVLGRHDAADGWTRLACPVCHWTAFEHPTPAPAPTGDAFSLKRLWVESWQACKAALGRGERAAADRAFDAWHEAESALRAALGAEEYAAWVASLTPEGGWWL